MSQGDGHWTDRRDGDRVQGSNMRIGPVFAGEVTYAAFGTGWAWKASLNGQAMGGYPTIEQAKARMTGKSGTGCGRRRKAINCSWTAMNNGRGATHKHGRVPFDLLNHLGFVFLYRLLRCAYTLCLYAVLNKPLNGVADTV